MPLPGDSEEVTAELLRHYKLFNIPLEVYSAAEDLQIIALEGRLEPLVFAYDWRKGLREIAKDLDERLRTQWKEQLSGKRVIIVGHSMGGLVAWTWKNDVLREQPKYDFEVEQMVLLGAPLQGSCEILWTLLKGYRLAPNTSGIVRATKNQAMRYAFRNLRPAALTFQSSFELLPRFDGSEMSCLAMKNSKKDSYSPVDHFSLPSWRLLGSFLGRQPRGFWRNTLSFLTLNIHPRRADTVWNDLGTTKEGFDQVLADNLDSGRSFRDWLDFDESPLEDRIHYFYSTEEKTLRQLGVHLGSRYARVQDTVLGDGDGRVLGTSARPSLTGRLPHSLKSSHMGLLKDSSFRQSLTDLVRMVQDGISVAEISSSPDMRAAFSRSGAVLSLSTIDPVGWTDTEPSREVALARDLNTESLEYHLGTDELPSTEALIHAANTFKVDDSGETPAGIAIYETALSLSASRGQLWHPDLLDGYTTLLSDNDQIYAARRFIEQSLGKAKNSMLDKNGLSSLMNSYGRIFETEGSRDEAIQWYRHSAARGNTQALNSLRRLDASSTGDVLSLE